MKAKMTIGLLGGIGPEATGEFYTKLIAALQATGRIARNEDYPRIVVNSIPAPELVRHPVTDEELAPYREGIRQLDRQRPDLIVMVCNSIHLYRERLQEESKAEILDLPAEIRRRVAQQRKIGVLGVTATVKEGLYALPGAEMLYPSPAEMEELMAAVIKYNRGEERAAQQALVERIAQRLVDLGAETLILGCTEFAVMLEGSQLATVNSIGVLVEETVERFLASKKGEEKG